MLNRTDAIRRGFRRLNGCLQELLAARDKLEAASVTVSPENYGMYADWEDACHRFQQAHESWRDLAWGSTKPPTEPVIDLTALSFDAYELAV